MADRQPLNATFFAFKKREPRGVIMRASIGYLVIALLLIGAFVGVFWSQLGAALDWYAQILDAILREDEGALRAVAMPPGIVPLGLGLLVWTFFYYLLSAAYEAACLKWFVHGETGGFMGLSLGAETWRVWGVYWVWFALNVCFSIVAELTSAALSGMAVVATGQAAAMSYVSPVLEAIQFVIVVYFAVRLAPAAATSIALRRFAFFDAWKTTRGRFAPLLGSFALLYAVYYVVSLALGLVAMAVVFGGMPDLSSGDLKQIARDLLRSILPALAQPQTWIAMAVAQVVGMILAAVFFVAMYGVNARAAQAALADGALDGAD